MSTGWMDPLSAPRAAACAARLLTGVLDIVVRRLPEHETHEPARCDDRLQLAPDRDDDVLRRRDHAPHEWYVQIEVLVIDQVHGALLDDLLERAEIQHVARPVVDRPADRDVE